jgi:hypothetical protein
VDTNKILNDITIGKLAEWGVYFIFLDQGRHTITTPDMKIYLAKQKSFECDLQEGIHRLHVKGQTIASSNAYGHSWMLQAKDPLFEKSDSNDIIIGCSVDWDEEAVVTILLEERFENLKIGEPKMSKFVNGKKAIYLRDNLEE